ncbi:MAG: hypothetical protein SWH61_17675 [Thermodesulfobacteriota bacterium]|nr:hypothetical protein [Thermodesulfobacteriota bacterium]
MNDGDLLARSILVHYDDLCESPAVMLRNIYRHCELEVEEGILNTQASGISAPSYYAPLLTEKETDIVHFEAAGVYKQMLKLAGRE